MRAKLCVRLHAMPRKDYPQLEIELPIIVRAASVTVRGAAFPQLLHKPWPVLKAAVTSGNSYASACRTPAQVP